MTKALISLLSLLFSNFPKISSLHYGPFWSAIPDYLLEKFDSSECAPGWLFAGITVKNISSRTIPIIRIKLKRKYAAKPSVTREKEDYQDWDFDESKGEVVIRNLDAKVEIDIHIFLSQDDQGVPIEPAIFVDGQLYGGVQRFIASWHDLFASKIGLMFGGFFSLIIVLLGYLYCFVIFPCTFESSDSCRVEQASERLAGYCHLQSQKVNTNTWRKVHESSFPLELTLFINKAQDIHELLRQEKIVTCVPVPDSQ